MKKRYWLRGGVISLVISFLLLLMTPNQTGIIPNGITCCSAIANSECALDVPQTNYCSTLMVVSISTYHNIASIISFPLIIAEGLWDSFSKISDSLYYTLWYVNFGFGYFVIGVILGWIYGKIKNRNKVTSSNNMKKLQAGFIVPLLVILGALVVVGIGVGTYSYLHNTQQEQGAQKMIPDYATSSSSNPQVSYIHDSKLSTSTNATSTTMTKATTKIIQNKVAATITKTNQQLYSISKNDSGNYVLNKNITINDSSYVITKVDGYDLLKFSTPSGVEVDGDGGSPNLPVYRIDIRLPLDTKIQNVKVDFGNKKYLGKLNLPIENPMPNCMGCQTGPAYSPHPTSGILPKVAYGSNLAKIDGSSMTLVVMVYPITYNNATEDTYVYDGFKIAAEYSTKNQVIIDHDKVKPTRPGDVGNTFISGQDIVLSVPIINMTSDSVNIKMSSNLSAEDGVNKVISSNQSSQVISGNTTSIISTTLKAPNDPGNGKTVSDYGADYGIVGDIYNGNSKIDSIGTTIRIKPSTNVEISCFKYPDNVSYHSKVITTSDFVTFEVCVKNPTTQKIRAYVNLNIGEQGSTDVKRPQGFIDIDPGQTKSYTDKWIPGNYLRTGLYTVQAIVSTGNYQTFQTGQFDYSADDASN